MNSSYQILLKILKENFGIIFLDDENQDFAIGDYIQNSIDFITFIVSIEEELGAELPDDFLNFELLASSKGFLGKLDYFRESIADNKFADCKMKLQ